MSLLAALLISHGCWPRVSHEPVDRCQLDQARTRKCLISHAHMPTSTRPRQSAMAPALATRRSCFRSSRAHTATRRLTRHLHQALMLPRFRVLGDCTRPLEAWPCGLQCRLAGSLGRPHAKACCSPYLATQQGSPLPSGMAPMFDWPILLRLHQQYQKNGPAGDLPITDTEALARLSTKLRGSAVIQHQHHQQHPHFHRKHSSRGRCDRSLQLPLHCANELS
jgi:hypothetical protein